MAYQHIKVPPGGEKIRVNQDFSLSVPDNPIILCQTAVAARAQLGDSGSPVFSYTSQGNVAIAGILWRQAEIVIAKDSIAKDTIPVFVFSPVDQIRKDVVAFSPY